MLLAIVASTQFAQMHAEAREPERPLLGDTEPQSTVVPFAIPTVELPRSTPVVVPTVMIPPPTPTPTRTPMPTRTPTPTPRSTRVAPTRSKRARAASKPKTTQAQPSGQWIWAYLTSYCPGSAGWISSSGMPVFYGMLANDFYAFGTRVYLPVLGMTGVVEDRVGSFLMWNHFDVWSPVCYSTPTGWFKVAVQTR